MAPAVTMALGRVVGCPRSYTMGRAWKLAGLSEVSSRGPRPHFGLDRSPQQAEFWQPQAIFGEP